MTLIERFTPEQKAQCGCGQTATGNWKVETGRILKLCDACFWKRADALKGIKA